MLGAEQPGLRVYAVDPGDMRTQMHQDAFPGEDISDRPPPEESVPGLLALIDGDAAERALPRPRHRRSVGVSALAFELSPGLEAHEPPEARGLGRDDVRLLVTDRARQSVVARALPRPAALLAPGDLLVVNTSATLAAALPATRHDGLELELRLSTPAPGSGSECGGSSSCGADDAPFGAARRTTGSRCPPARRRSILGAMPERRLVDRDSSTCRDRSRRICAEHGQPIRYGYVPAALADRRVPERLRARARQRRDAERRTARSPPSCSRALVAGGVLVAPVTLHAGVSSLERGEPPYPERYRVPAADRAARQRRARAGAAA